MGMSTTKSYFIQNSKRMMSRDRNRFISIIFATNLRVERESLKAGLARISIGQRLPTTCFEWSHFCLTFIEKVQKYLDAKTWQCEWQLLQLSSCISFQQSKLPSPPSGPPPLTQSKLQTITTGTSSAHCKLSLSVALNVNFLCSTCG